MTASVKETIMLELKARVVAAFAWALLTRSHHRKTTVDESPAARVYEVKDEPLAGKESRTCMRQRRLTARIEIDVRSDTGREDLDPLWIAVQQKLGLLTWPVGVVIEEGATSWDDEIADKDANRMRIELTFCYATPGWNVAVNANAP